MALLDLRRLYFETELAVTLVQGPVDPMAWDAHRDTFARMLALAEQTMDVSDDDDDDYRGGSDASGSGSGSGAESDGTTPPPGRTPRFHMNSGAVPLVYGIVHKCRDPWIRRGGVRLLSSQNRQEGIWSSRTILGTVLRVIELEEYGLDNPQTCADIPPEARVRRIRVVKTDEDIYTVGFEMMTTWLWEEARKFAP